MTLDPSRGLGGLCLDRCEVCDLPFRTRKEIEDQLDRGMDTGEIYTWIQDRFNFEVSHDSVASHKDHIFLADHTPSCTSNGPHHYQPSREKPT